MVARLPRVELVLWHRVGTFFHDFISIDSSLKKINFFQHLLLPFLGIYFNVMTINTEKWQ